MSVPYIGAKISLTSRSLIRYEGILAGVNPSEATISLERVRMMGTEGRRPGQEIPASNDVYDVVEFRSADIEDLQIFEPPAPPAPKPFADPAIISSTSSATAPAARPLDYSGAGSSSGGWPAAPRLQFGTAAAAEVAPVGRATQFGSVPVAPTQPSAAAPSLGWNAPAKPTAPLVRPSFGSLADEARPSAYASVAAPLKPAELQKPRAPDAFHSHATAASAATANANAAARKDDKVMAYNSVTGKIEMVERTTRSYAAVVSDGAGRFRLSGDAQARVVPHSDYDFAQANARLQKDAPVPARDAPKEAFYDKTSSFFDNISCEATGAKEGRDKNERRWNIETFGVAAPVGQQRVPNYHHRRGGYSQRGRGHSRETLPR